MILVYEGIAFGVPCTNESFITPKCLKVCVDLNSILEEESLKKLHYVLLDKKVQWWEVKQEGNVRKSRAL